VAKRGKGSRSSQGGRTSQNRKNPARALPLRLPYYSETRLSYSSVLIPRPGLTLNGVTIINCTTGIRSENAVIDLQGVDILDCDTGIEQIGGYISGKNVRIKQTGKRKSS